MTRNIRWSALALLFPALLCLSCVRLHGPEDVRRDLSREAGVRLNREMGITVTRSGVWLARKILKWSGEEEIPKLKGIRRVEVGIYEVRGLRKGVDAPRPFELAEFDGWDQIARIRDGGEEVHVMVREVDGILRNMLVVVAADDEWVLVRIRGRLDRIVQDAMRLAFDQADRPDLYAQAAADAERRREDAEAEPPLDTLGPSACRFEDPVWARPESLRRLSPRRAD